jgi:hypothetical protein
MKNKPFEGCSLETVSPHEHEQQNVGHYIALLENLTNNKVTTTKKQN